MSSRRQDNGSKRHRGRRRRRTEGRALAAAAIAVQEQTAAAARGDAAGALAALRRGGCPPEAIEAQELGFLDRLGGDVPDWLVARWACDTALGWMLERQDHRIESAAWAVVATHEPPPPGTSPEDIVRRFQLIAAYDAIAHQQALFELGGLADFLDVRAEPPLLERAPRLREWSVRRWSVLEQVDLRNDVLRVRDVVTGDTYDVLHLGAANGVGRDVLLLGRVAPVVAHPGWVFVHRPMAVDPETARRLVRLLQCEKVDEDEVFACMGDAVTDGRMPPAPGMRLRTWLWSDTLLDPGDYAAAGMVDGRVTTVDDQVRRLEAALPELECDDEPPHGDEPGRLVELREHGVADDVATGVMTCEAALLFARLNSGGHVDGGLEVAAVNAASNLWHPPIVDGVREHATPPDSGPLWRDVAACLAEPFRSLCLGFAETADAKSAAA
ncbi:hypothetical protein [Solicola gregarius]|uniref:Uncharacterized protein n=1 Tax=Solicola gregarius TaxID=2908642 RepID=A0AA46TG17_9ACTN|nr:hypothetical protein [Solicola gregarius]UYM04689.1 hypothetical protein L0C25_19455 [Solicola gregarius]